MSYGRMNIWLRYCDCWLIEDCWRTDLVIKTCGGQNLLDMERTGSVAKKVKSQFPANYSVTEQEYRGEKTLRIATSSPATPANHINHVEVDVPPGCYIVWTRVCYKGNEDTHKVMAVVNCGEECCINLILPTVESCGKEFIYPFMQEAVALKIPADRIALAAKVIMDVAKIKPKDFKAQLAERAVEIRVMKDKKITADFTNIRRMVK